MIFRSPYYDDPLSMPAFLAEALVNDHPHWSQFFVCDHFILVILEIQIGRGFCALLSAFQTLPGGLRPSAVGRAPNVKYGELASQEQTRSKLFTGEATN